MPKLMSQGLSPMVSYDRGTRVPIYEQIADALRQAITKGRITEGTRLASTRVLADDWHVSRNTVLQIFDMLGSEGYVTSHVGDGTYVTDIARSQGIPITSNGLETEGRASKYPFRRLSRRGRNTVTTVAPYKIKKPVAFAPNMPDYNDFPMRSWLRLMNEVSGGLTGSALASTLDAGFLPLRQAIAHRLSVARGITCDPEQVIVTSGSQQGLDLVFRMLTDRGDPVWVENPGYGGTRGAASAQDLNLQSMQVDRHGARIEDAIQNNLAPRIICLSPARQFPTGAVLSQRRREEVLSFADKSGAWILEDDFDGEFQYVAPQPAPLAAQDLSNRVILLATLSTTLVPSLRMGYLVVPPDLIRPFQTARALAHGDIALLEQMVVAEMMKRGIYAAHVRKMRKQYRSRQTALAQALKDVLGYSVPRRELDCGMHLVLPLMDSVNDTRISQDLAVRGIMAQPLSPLFSGKSARQGLLLGFAAYPEEQLRAKAQELAGLVGLVDTYSKDWRSEL